MDDAALVAAARSGDRDAVAAIYDRYADRLHDFCHSILRDRDEAADAFHDAFLVAVQRLHQLRDPERLRPWLYAIARNEALRRARARTRMSPTEQVDDVTSTAPGGEQTVEESELRALVWAAAGGLSERDRVLLDLHVRQGLEGQELALAAGESPGNIYVLLSRLRRQVERALGALLVARVGRRDCQELDRLLQSWDGTFSPLIRKRVARHVDGCEICEDRRRTLASPLALLSAVPVVVAPAALRERVLGDAELVAHQGPSGDGPSGGGPSGGGAARYDEGGFPKARRRRSPGAVAAAVLSAAIVGLLLAMAMAGGDDAATVASSEDATTTITAPAPTSAAVPELTTPALEAPTTTPPGPAAPPSSAAPASPAGPPAPGPGGAVPPPAPGGRGGTDGGTGVAPGVTPDAQGPLISGLAAQPSEISESGLRTCSGPSVSTVTARVTDPSGVRSASLSWTVGGVPSSKAMTRAGDTWTATVGPYDAGTVAASTRIRLTMSATDQAGNASAATTFLTLLDCASPAPR